MINYTEGGAKLKCFKLVLRLYNENRGDRIWVKR
jgi:hypothetical protein